MILQECVVVAVNLTTETGTDRTRAIFVSVRHPGHVRLEQVSELRVRTDR